MKLSMKWLRDYVDAEMSLKTFADGMTMSGSKVEVYHSLHEGIHGVVVARVESLKKHENSDKLWICQVNVGNKTVQIVTGAQNLFEGAVVPAVLPGGRVIDRHTGQYIDIKSGVLRGEPSEGMLCSMDELGFDKTDFPYQTEDGILVLNPDPDFDKLKLGEDFFRALDLNDDTVEFEITNNRPDCLSVIGLAREASATFSLPFKAKEPAFKGISEDITKQLSVTVENTQLCSRYMAAMVKNVKIGPSPRWLAQRLKASGVRAINNLVDITNYVMLEYGHPMHAFDARYLEDNAIIVRNAKEGETITLLDGAEIHLSPEMLVIADGKKPVAVAGIMGGKYSSIFPDTQTVIFESACFDGVSVRRTAKKINHRTESSSRFEKGIDPINAKNALYRALELIELLGCGEVVNTIIDADHSNKTPYTLPHDWEGINALLGDNIPKERQIQILESLGFTVKDGMVTVPSVRIDIEGTADLAEEVGRIYGFNEIPSTVPSLESAGVITKPQQLQNRIISYMLSQGCYETMTFSFISPKGYEKAKVQNKTSVVIRNPLGEDTSVMRASLLPSMLDVLSRNFNNRTPGGRFFEIGREYIPVEGERLPEEKEILCIGLYGEKEDFYTLKGIVERLYEKLDIQVAFRAKKDNPSYHVGRCAEVLFGDRVIGVFGELHPAVCEAYDMDVRAYAAEIQVKALHELANYDRKYQPLPKFPALTRDLSLVCDEAVTNAEIITLIKENATHLEDIALFDVYRSEQIGEGKKSLSYTLTFRLPDATMKDTQADEAVSRILTALEKSGITLRKQG